jgi:hypothetical protein
MYNDYGSFARGREEGNLACADFFLKGSDGVSPHNKTETDLKRAQVSDEHAQQETSVKRQKTIAENGTGMATVENGVDLEATLVKEKLMSLAQFERQYMKLTLTRLQNTGLKKGCWKLCYFSSMLQHVQADLCDKGHLNEDRVGIALVAKVSEIDSVNYV